MFHKVVFGPVEGYDDLKKMIKEKKITAYIITGRNESLENDFNQWMKKIDAKKYFSGCYFNDKNEQPYFFKEKMITRLKLDVFVEDNWDIVKNINSDMKKQRNYVRVFWIYNLLDRNIPYKLKFPTLMKVLESILK